MPKRLSNASEQLARERRRAADDVAQRRRPGRRARGVEHRGQDRRHRRERDRLELGDRLPERRGREALPHRHLAADHHRDHAGHDLRVDVEQRQDHPDPLAGHQRQQLRAHRRVGQHVAVRQHRPLRLAGRPRGVHQRGQIIMRPPGRRDLAAATGQRVERQIASVLHGDHVPEAAELRRPARVDQRPRPPGIGDDRHGSRMTDHVRRLRRGERRIDRSEHRPGLEDRPPRLEELEAVGQHHRHDVTGLDAQISQSGSQCVGAGVELAVANRLPPPANERLVGDAGGLRAEQLGDGVDRAHRIDLLIGAWVMTRLIRGNRSDIAVVRPQNWRPVPVSSTHRRSALPPITLRPWSPQES